MTSPGEHAGLPGLGLQGALEKRGCGCRLSAGGFHSAPAGHWACCSQAQSLGLWMTLIPGVMPEGGETEAYRLRMGLCASKGSLAGVEMPIVPSMAAAD